MFAKIKNILTVYALFSSGICTHSHTHAQLIFLSVPLSTYSSCSPPQIGLCNKKTYWFSGSRREDAKGKCMCEWMCICEAGLRKSIPCTCLCVCVCVCVSAHARVCFPVSQFVVPWQYYGPIAALVNREGESPWGLKLSRFSPSLPLTTDL